MKITESSNYSSNIRFRTDSGSIEHQRQALKNYQLTAEPMLTSTTDGKTGATRRVLPRVYEAFGKRLLDILCALILAPVVLVAIAVVALPMWLTGDRGPIVFGHRRIGRNGKVFRCWKIRTMVTESEDVLKRHLLSDPRAAAEWARDRKLSDDPRITRLGHFLRRTSLDELPQAWNVLRGEMSFVGPRPVVRVEMHKYGAHREAYASVRPGVTGLWQISGRNDISYAERVQLDVTYIREMSFLLDLRVILGTVGAMLRKTGK